jgi:hypothetical protein
MDDPAETGHAFGDWSQEDNDRHNNMIDEQVPVVWEIEVFLGKKSAPTGYTVYRYANGYDFSGSMESGQPHGFGVMRGPILTYIGTWQMGQFVKGIMVDAAMGAQFHIPLESVGPLDPQQNDRG